MPMHFEKQVQIKAQIGVLLFDKALTELLAKYSNYNNIFSVKNSTKLLEKTAMNEYAIKLEKNK